MIKIITAPNPILSQIAKPIGKIDNSINHLISEMKETLKNTHDPEGIGLAAPQVGQSIQLFIIKPKLKAIEQAFINPTVIPKRDSSSRQGGTPNDNDKTTKKLEGCLSLQTIWGEVKRYPSITVSYLDEHGIQHMKTVSGFPAIIIQHEYDHLQGILFPKRVLEQKGKLYKSHKDKEGKDVFEEIKI